ncbi:MULTISPECIES: thiol reductant ABC exporter subunit CydD [unclassified Streptomyces]|uniref:thiol reductant ABC exporter subunit CydD n=1 Tax=unclassified Streptomyces TaxID=2593676 RepID=UPI000363073F|nr:thiol reductant ABC exporter subunit CydD [Streptomyces sp. BoleA5]MYX36386.1 thiol reductant ABC exporter subunit CydD [Streptomyces sp. SID8377]
MKPVDPRLLRYARATRVFLAVSVLLGLVGAGLVIAQAMIVAEIVVGGFEDGLGAGALRTPLLLLAGVAAGRAAVSWLTELCAHRASAAVKSQLRTQLLERVTALGPAGLTERRTGELTTLATRGIDALDGYFARYLPQLGLAVVVPAAVLARIVTEDWISALTIALTLPLIPVFMVLIGWATQTRMDRQWQLLARLSGHFLDVVAGLPTLKVFGRAKAQAESIRVITADHRRATMRTLRITFLSSFALELLSTISVALVAVGVGMRLVHGELDLYTGLVILVLAPEAYLPLRQVGAQYHAAAEGLAAADEVFAVLETAPPRRGTAQAPDLRTAVVALDEVAVEGRLGPVSLRVSPGETIALTGPSGIGKSTLLSVLLGFTEPTSGRVLADGADLAAHDPAGWHRQIAWVPQRPHLFAGTIADNVRLTRPDASPAEVRAALRDAGAPDLDPATALGEGGAGLSAGQRQRVALARAFLADRPLLLLDEPTAALDGETEAAVVDAVRRLAAGRTVLLVVHRPALLAVADRTVRLDGRPPRAVPAAAPPARAAAGTPAPEPLGAALAVSSSSSSSAASATGSAPLTRVRRIATPLRPRFALALLLGALALLSAVGLMATSAWLISRASEQPPVLYLMVAVTATRAFGIGRAVFRYAERLVSHDAVLRALAGLRVTVYRRLERLAPAALRDTRRGDLLSRLVADVDGLQDYFLRWLLPAGAAALSGTAAAAFTVWLLPGAGAALAVGLLTAGVAVPAASAALARRAERALAPARGELAAQVVEVLTGTAELTVAGALPGRRAKAAEADRALTRIAARSAAGAALGAGLGALVSGLTVTLCAWAGVRAVADGGLSGVALAVVVLTPLAAFEAVTALPLAAQYRQRSRQAARRVYDVLDTPEPVREPAHPAAAPAGPHPLVLRGLTARHPGQPRPALDGVGLELSPGRRIAVVGPSGSGKTTLAHVLLRFLDVEEGAYTLAGSDATALDGDAVRRMVGLCAQDAHAFDSTVRENLRLARPGADDTELRKALAAARLDLDLDLPVGEHGTRLSGGQRQRLALARALLADFPVLVLDEPAEHLDLATADALTADLLAATTGRTTVLITHRLTGLEEVDEILVLDHGRVVQRGTHRELAAADGPFRRSLDRERAADAPNAPEPESITA